MKTVIFRDNTTSIEVVDNETMQSQFFESLGEVLDLFDIAMDNIIILNSK